MKPFLVSGRTGGLEAIKNGIQLPENHGKIGDLDALAAAFEEEGFTYESELISILSKTLVEATDREGEEKGEEK